MIGRLFFFMLLERFIAGCQQSPTVCGYGLVFNDPQLKFATSALYVIDGTTGKGGFDQNGSTGMATASTLKVITATGVGYTGKGLYLQNQDQHDYA